MRQLISSLALLLLLTACVPADPDDPAEQGAIIIVAMAAPTCAVETDPPDPECAPRPVAAAPIVVTRAVGSEVIAEGETDAEGRLTLAMPAGDYLVMAGTVEGLLGPSQPVVVSVLAGVTTEVPIGYDTGIR